MSFLLGLNISLQQSIKQMSGPTEEFSLSSASPLSTGGGRRRMSRKLRATKKKLLKLKKQIKRMGGGEQATGGLEQAAAGLGTAATNVGGATELDKEAPGSMDGARRRRSRKTRRGRKSRRSLFGY